VKALARSLGLLAPLGLIGLALLLLPKVWLGATGVYADAGALSTANLLTVTALFKLFFLATATLAAWGAAAAFGGGNPAGAGWRMFGLGLTAFTTAQLILGWYQLVLRTEAPFPSAADPLFVAGMVLWVAALLRFLFVYTGDALPLGTRREAWLLCLATAVPLVALGWWLLRPVLAHQAPPAEQALNVTYPLLDCLLLLPTVALARITARLRGGRLQRVWALLLAGFLATAAGDVTFAYLVTVEMASLEPLVHLLFGASYALIAWGTALQLRLVGGDAPAAVRATAVPVGTMP
jgi:hypothetical protein